jgi:hypothetical protein
VGTFTLRWPVLHNLILRTPPIQTNASRYPAIFNLNLISAGGTSCMFASFLSAFFLKVSIGEFVGIIFRSVRQLALPILTISSVLSMAFVMNYSGAIGTLGLAFSATGAAFPFFSPLLGWLGVFLTGSDTSSNALFGNLQTITAGRLGFSPILIAAANSSGDGQDDQSSIHRYSCRCYWNHGPTAIAIAAIHTETQRHPQHAGGARSAGFCLLDWGVLTSLRATKLSNLRRVAMKGPQCTRPSVHGGFSMMH